MTAMNELDLRCGLGEKVPTLIFVRSLFVSFYKILEVNQHGKIFVVCDFVT